MGVASDLVIKPTVRSSNVASALDAWRKATPAAGSLVDNYLKTRGIILPPPLSIRFLPRQRNWNDGKTYPAMISLVQRVPGADDYAALERCPSLIDAGAHFTFLQDGRPDGAVVKAATDASKLTLGQLRHGGVWLSSFQNIGEQFAVAEGIETALSVMQLTKLPTVAAFPHYTEEELRPYFTVPFEMHVETAPPRFSVNFERLYDIDFAKAEIEVARALAAEARRDSASPA